MKFDVSGKPFGTFETTNLPKFRRAQDLCVEMGLQFETVSDAEMERFSERQRAEWLNGAALSWWDGAKVCRYLDPDVVPSRYVDPMAVQILGNSDAAQWDAEGSTFAPSAGPAVNGTGLRNFVFALLGIAVVLIFVAALRFTAQ